MPWIALGGGGGSPFWRPRGGAGVTRRSRSTKAAANNTNNPSSEIPRGATTRWPNTAVIASVAVGAAASVAAGISFTTQGQGGLDTRGLTHVFASLSGSSVGPAASALASSNAAIPSTDTAVRPRDPTPLGSVDADTHAAAVNDWHERWHDGRIGFHLPRTHRLLMKHKNSLLGEGVTSPPELSKRVFVPLCGKAVDMLWLAACGHRVYGVDLSGVAAKAFFDESGLPRTSTSADRAPGGVTETWSAGVRRVHTSGNVAIVEGDLFSIRPNPDPRPDETNKGWFGGVTVGSEGEKKSASASGPYAGNKPASVEELDARVGAQGSISFREEAVRFASGGGPAMDAVWDRGALVAVEPELRERYADIIHKRLAPGGRMLVVGVSYDPHAGCVGPPHNVPHEELVRLYESRGCEVTLLGSEEVIDTAPPRMREKIESMTESVYLVRKPHRRGKGGFHLPRPRL